MTINNLKYNGVRVILVVMSSGVEWKMPPLDPAIVEKVKNFLTNALNHELESHPFNGDPRLAALKRLDEICVANSIHLDEGVRQKVFNAVIDNLLGYGPLQALLDDPTIGEIMVNGWQAVFVERNGELIETGIHFENDRQVMQIIDRIILPLGRRVDSDHPMVDARLPDGSRVNVIIPPSAVDGPCITIRKFLQNRMTMQDLINIGTLTENMADFLKACIVARLNIIISGPTSAGKTTFLNILSSYIPGQQRIITIEDAVELKLQQRHVIRMETKNATVDGEGEVTIRDLVRNALRMRPDRIIIGEVRTAEAMDMIQAMNTGHHGSITTVHANSPREAISRLETLGMMAGLDIPMLAIRRQIASAVNLVIHISRLTDGSRKITNITEISGMEGEVVTMTDIFKFEQTGVTPDGKILGKLKATGLRPLFTPRLEVVGYKLRAEIFNSGSQK
jgi:pilus assembly protein CpaF